MPKPSHWKDQPARMLEDWLWERSLHYDGYESSKAEEVHSIMCNTPHRDTDNGRLLASAWALVSEEGYHSRLSKHRDWLKDELQEVEEQLNKNTALPTEGKPIE